MKPEGAVRLRIIPVTLPVANRYVKRWHRHHGALETEHGGTIRTNKGFVWFCLACIDPEGVIVGVGIMGRPTNRNSDDGQTVEVIRTATDGTPNVCSALLGAAARTAAAMGAYRIITYTLDLEPGTSLRAAGWSQEADGITTCWTKGKGKAVPGGSGNTIWREHMNASKSRWIKYLRPGPVEVHVVDAPDDETVPRLFEVAAT